MKIKIFQYTKVEYLFNSFVLKHSSNILKAILIKNYQYTKIHRKSNCDASKPSSDTCQGISVENSKNFICQGLQIGQTLVSNTKNCEKTNFREIYLKFFGFGMQNAIACITQGLPPLFSCLSFMLTGTANATAPITHMQAASSSSKHQARLSKQWSKLSKESSLPVSTTLTTSRLNSTFTFIFSPSSTYVRFPIFNMAKKDPSFSSHPLQEEQEWEENLRFRDKFPTHPGIYLTEIVNTNGDTVKYLQRRKPGGVEANPPPIDQEEGLDQDQEEGLDQDQEIEIQSQELPKEFLVDLDPNDRFQKIEKLQLASSKDLVSKRSKKSRTSMKLGLPGISQEDMEDQDQDQGQDQDPIPVVRGKRESLEKGIEKGRTHGDQENPDENLETLVTQFTTQARVQARRIRNQARAIALEKELQRNLTVAQDSEKLSGMKAEIQALKSRHNSLINRVVDLELSTGKRIRVDTAKREQRLHKKLKLVSPETILQEFQQQMESPHPQWNVKTEELERPKKSENDCLTFSRTAHLTKKKDHQVMQKAALTTMVPMIQDQSPQKAAQQANLEEKQMKLWGFNRETWQAEIAKLQMAAQEKQATETKKAMEKANEAKKAMEKAKEPSPRQKRPISGLMLWILWKMITMMLLCLNWLLQPLVLMALFLDNMVNSQAPKSYSQISAQGNQMERMEKMLVGLNSRLETHIELLSFHQNSLTISGWAIAIVSLVIILALTICQFQRWRTTRSTGQPNTQSPVNSTGGQNPQGSSWNPGHQGMMGNQNPISNPPPYYAHSTGALSTAPINFGDHTTQLLNQGVNLNPNLGQATFQRPIFQNQNRSARFANDRFEDLDEVPEFPTHIRRNPRQARSRPAPINHLNNIQVTRPEIENDPEQST